MAFDPTKPVQTRAGRTARIVCTDMKNNITGRSILALLENPFGHEICVTYYPNGRLKSNDEEDQADLVNIPVKKWKWVFRLPNYDIVVSHLHMTEEEARKSCTLSSIIGRIMESEITE